jgi:hypothetical protein
LFLVRRTFKVKKGTARKAADVITQIGKMYEEAGLRTHSRVYISGSTVPGPADTVYMDWAEEALRSAYRSDNPKPPQEDELFAKLNEFQEETSIEFFEMYGES